MNKNVCSECECNCYSRTRLPRDDDDGHDNNDDDDDEEAKETLKCAPPMSILFILERAAHKGAKSASVAIRREDEQRAQGRPDPGRQNERDKVDDSSPAECSRQTLTHANRPALARVISSSSPAHLSLPRARGQSAQV